MPTSASNSDQTVIRPIDEMILAHAAKRLTRVFGAPFVETTSEGETQIVLEQLGGKPLKPPYGTYFVSIKENTESWNRNMLARRGLPAMRNQTQLQSLRLIPARFEFDIKFYSTSKPAANQFTVDWMFAKQLGSLKFKVRAGGLRLEIGCDMQPDPDTPPRPQVTEGESKFITTAHMTLTGYVSAKAVKNGAVIETVDVETVVSSLHQDANNHTFIPFPKRS